jgi:prophage maintenance system killer protein
VKDKISDILNSSAEAIDVAINLCMYCMKAQIFIDGNKRASVIFANHYLIAHGQGFLVIPEEYVPDFKKLLISYYEGEDIWKISDFLKMKCWRTF